MAFLHGKKNRIQLLAAAKCEPTAVHHRPMNVTCGELWPCLPDQTNVYHVCSTKPEAMFASIQQFATPKALDEMREE